MRRILHVILCFAALFALASCSFDSLEDLFQNESGDTNKNEKPNGGTAAKGIKVTLDYGDGRTEVRTVDEYGWFEEPEVEEIEGYRFIGWWYYNPKNDTWVAIEEITKDITLTARWSKLYLITYYDENDNVLEEVEICNGDYVVFPKFETKLGTEYAFYYNEQLLTDWFEYKLESDMDIICKEISFVNTLVNDLDEIQDENKGIDFTLLGEPIQLTIWAVQNAQDDEIQKQLINKFNEEYKGQIEINLVFRGSFDYFVALESTFITEVESFPDLCFMDIDYTVQYANKGYFCQVDKLLEKIDVGIDYNNLYDNISRATEYEGSSYSVPVSSYGFLTNFRQDIIKKNNLGWENNTRYIPQTKAEYEELLTKSRALADSGNLWVRDIRKGENHSWYQLKNGNPDIFGAVTKETFYPEFTQSCDMDGLSALYANGGSLLSANGKVNYQNCRGFVEYVTDQVTRYNNKLMGGTSTHTEMFGKGACIMFSEGPWFDQQFSPFWNNSELSAEGNGVSAEDAADPVYRNPYVASRPTGWWTLEDAPEETADKWYGSGYAMTVNTTIGSLKRAAAALEFIKWYTQGQDENGNYHLTNFCSLGSVPAWKNVYESDGYKAALSQSIVLQALGDPKDIITVEGTVYYSLLIDGIASSISSVQSKLKYGFEDVTISQAEQIIFEGANNTQAAIDLFNFQ